MSHKQSIIRDVGSELRFLNQPPRLFLKSIISNGVISALFFLGSLFLGTYNDKFLPIAAAILLLWTLADVTLSNQIIFDKQHSSTQLKKYGNYKRLFTVNNLTVVILSIPITLLFGLLLVAIVGKWSEIIYGLIIGLTLIWGWLGIANVMSVVLPFEKIDLKNSLQDRRKSTKYIILYCLPWILLPIYALIICLPLILLGWTNGGTGLNHKFLASIIILSLSFLLWWTGLIIASHQATHPDKRLQKLLNN